VHLRDDAYAVIQTIGGTLDDALPFIGRMIEIEQRIRLAEVVERALNENELGPCRRCGDEAGRMCSVEVGAIPPPRHGRYFYVLCGFCESRTPLRPSRDAAAAQWRDGNLSPPGAPPHWTPATVS
jgi:hypothetical protein